MVVMLVTYILNITIVLRKNHMKNQIVLLTMIIMLMMLLMEMETIRMSSLILNWRYKIHSTQNQISTSFYHICIKYKKMM